MFKKFQILYERAINHFRRSNNPIEENLNMEESSKKFVVIKETHFAPPPKKSGKLTKMTETRPQKCPMCHTGGSSNIFRTPTPEKTWGCKKCGHEW